MQIAGAQEFRKIRPVQAALDPAEPSRPPLGAPALLALMDLGLTDAQIARYFKVSEERIASLQRYYGLA